MRRHLAPKCPLKRAPRSESAPPSPCSCGLLRPPSSSISMESPVSVQDDGSSAKAGRKSNCDQSSPTTFDMGVLDTGTIANAARVQRLEHQKKILGTDGVLAYWPIRNVRVLNLATVGSVRRATLQISRTELRAVEGSSRPLGWRLNPWLVSRIAPVVIRLFGSKGRKSPRG